MTAGGTQEAGAIERAGDGSRFAIVGAGLMGRWHADAGVRAGGRLVAICDPDSEAARGLAGRGPQISLYSQLAPLLASDRPDVVHICTPLERHAELIEQSLEAAADVIVEKPLAADAGETARLLGLARDRERVLCPVHQLVFQAWLGELERLGEILSLDYSACSAGATHPASDPDRVADDILSHPLSLFVALLSRGDADADAARDVGALAWSAQRAAPGELAAHATSGKVALGLSISLHGRPPRHELRATGTRGTLHADLFHGFAWREGASTSRAYKIARPFWSAGRQLAGAASNLARRAAKREPAYPGLRELISQVYGCRSRGTLAASPVPPDHTLAVARARDAIIAASG